ncbi:FliM/FliN family flagellar motor switch protein [Symbiopectobacterium purcellii]|uniref:FliM/FliN family flagellar motor switch protein n=1 Tax=Symbiopectobacterium purcellii TaxID=2871826 RepID=A0ABX9AI69_9ENTR|nr:FliM/FliN family flagellar motor switch protein [Symbiopectobacterium purcellii]QZN94808.1 FliM/FliN family flagellar motor switch protein [Symbiopectobacterium purcellii]
MIGQHLRSYSKRELSERRRVKTWQDQGFDVCQHLVPGNHLLHFIADTGWEGIIDLERWFCHRVPQSAALSSASWSPAQLETLFITCIQPINGLPQDLAYQRLESKGRVAASSVPAQAYACMASQGRVWLHTFPPHAPLEEGRRYLKADSLPLSIQFQIGYSHISMALLKRIQRGDVILVNHEECTVASSNHVLGRFIKIEEGFMFDETDVTAMSENESELSLPEHINEVAVAPVRSRDEIKIKLDVVLQQSTLSVAELESFYHGQVIPCHPDAEQNISIMANGVPVAKGELVWIEDSLGIEIKDIYQEAGDVSRQ